MIQKEGPKPDSPNAKTLSRFAEMARRAENTKMADEIITKSKVRWLLNQTDHPTTLKSPCQTVIPRKSSIKVNSVNTL